MRENICKRNDWEPCFRKRVFYLFLAVPSYVIRWPLLMTMWETLVRLLWGLLYLKTEGRLKIWVPLASSGSLLSWQLLPGPRGLNHPLERLCLHLGINCLGKAVDSCRPSSWLCSPQVVGWPRVCVSACVPVCVSARHTAVRGVTKRWTLNNNSKLGFTKQLLN